MILAGDIGGTNTRLGLFSLTRGQLALEVETTYPSQEYQSLEEIVRVFLNQHRHPIEAACLAVAGPVRGEQVATTNLPWLIAAASLREMLGTKAVTLINDLEAVAYGVTELEPQDLVTLHPGAEDATGNLAIIAAGTGLGEAAALWDAEQQRYRPFACEGGHADFAARNEFEAKLLQYLLERYERVSYERVLSGPGLYAIYEFLHHLEQGSEDPVLTATILRQQDPVLISNAALAGQSDRCLQALDLFISLYGAEAGNLALKMLASGGVYVGGGIAPYIVERMQQGIFIDSFLAKGRMRPLLEAMPVKIIVNDKTGLLGAARRAAG